MQNLTSTQLLEQLAWDLIDQHGVLDPLAAGESKELDLTLNQYRLLLWQLERIQKWPKRYSWANADMSHAESADVLCARAISAYAQIAPLVEKLEVVAEAALDEDDDALTVGEWKAALDELTKT